MANNFLVAGLGEVLWDCFPDQQRLGGAPANFACHVSQFGIEAVPISCVGDDELGQKARSEIKSRGVDNDYVFQNSDHPTGTVKVTLDDDAKPSYSITENVAWDHIPSSPDLLTLAKKLDAVGFGTLAQRGEESKATIQNVLAAMPDDALKILDVNLRGDYYSKEVLAESLELANVVKLSDEELPVIAKFFDLTGDVDQQLKLLVEQFDLRLAAYTMGSDGSKLVSPAETDVAKAVKVKSIDSVGAGDSFTAALTAGMLHKLSLKKCNELANQVAAFVCSHNGACPTLPENLRKFEL